jgi:hypothetical protein
MEKTHSQGSREPRRSGRRAVDFIEGGLKGVPQALVTSRSFVIRLLKKKYFRHGYRKYEFPQTEGQNQPG